MRRLGTGVLLLLLAGCASERWSYDRRGATPAALDHDLHVCRREAFRPSYFAIRPSDRYDQEAINRCMVRRGWVPRREE